MNEAERMQRDFVELATRSLEDSAPGLRDEARGELMGRLMQERLPDQETKVEAALSRLAKVPPGSWKWRGVLASGAVILVLVAMLVLQIFVAIPEIRLAPLVLGKASPQAWFHRFPESDRDFISAGNSKTFYFPTRRPQWEVLSDLEHYLKAFPGDPAVYECYALKYFETTNTLPPDYDEVWQRLDPDNGIWNLWAAAVKTMRPSGAPPHTPDDLAELSRLVESALSAPFLDTRIPELRVRRMAKFPAFPETYLGNAALLRFAEELRENRSDVTFSASMIPALFYLQARECQRTKDQERLRTLISSWRELCARLLLESSTYGEFHSKLYLLSMGNSLAGSAGALDLPAEEKQLQQLMADIQRITPIGLGNGSASGHYGLTRINPALVKTVGASTVARARARLSSVEDSPEAYAPGRHSESTAVERFLAMIAAILLFPILLVVWIESFRRGKRANGLADGLAPLLRGSDGIWTVSLGCLAPLLWYWVITRLTPLGLLEPDISGRTPYLGPALQALACLLFSMVLMMQAVQWRLRRQLGFLGLMPRNLWFGWGVAGMTALILPLLGGLQWLPPSASREALYGSIAACGIPVLWLLWQAGALFFSPGSSALGSVLQGRMLIPPLITACALMIGIQLPLKSIEQHWLSLDEVTRCDLSRGGVPPAEAKKVEELARQLAAVLRDET